MVTFQVKDLGLLHFSEAYQIQKQCVDDVLQNGVQSLLLCEHPPVLTLGRSSHESNILLSQEEINEKMMEIIPIDRGGDITLHCPGQLVIYPILDLTHWGKDLHLYLHKLEQVAIDLLNSFGIVANRFSGRTGVWIGQEKIVSIGIGVRKWISFHGLSINVNPDLKLYSMINPCGFNIQMTSIAKIKQSDMEIRASTQPLSRKALIPVRATVNTPETEMKLVKDKFIQCFRKNFNLKVNTK